MATNGTDLRELETLDRKHLLHPGSWFTPSDSPMFLQGGKRITVTNARGQSFLDATAGMWCVNLGYGREELGAVMQKSAASLGFYPTWDVASNEASVLLAERLTKIAPGKMSRVFFGLSGSDANDTLIKLAWAYNNLTGRPKKKKIVSRKLGYHGSTAVAASLTGSPGFFANFDLPLERFLHTTAPDVYRRVGPERTEEQHADELVADLEALIEREGGDTIAAFIAEPIMGASGGVRVPPKGYFQRVQEVLKKHEILMIADEVICGFGRLGQMFGSHYYGIEPDMISCAKGLTSAYFPMSACMVTEEIWEGCKKGAPAGYFGHGFTYSGHPTGAAVAMATLDIVEREGVVENSARVGRYLQTKLREKFTDHPLVGDVRGVGLMAGLELVADKKSKTPFDMARHAGQTVAAAGLQEGIIIRALRGDIIAISPALIINEAEVDDLVDRCGRALDAAAKTLEIK